MAKSTMTKFMANFANDHWLVLRAPTDDQLESVFAWLADRKLTVEDSQDTVAIFTPSGKGKPAIALALKLTCSVPGAFAQMLDAYPAPKTLAGLVLGVYAETA
jgi:hypothetical protein